MDEQVNQGTPAPAPAPSVAQSPSQSPKKGGAATVIVIVLVVLVVLGVGGYFASRYVARKAGEKLTEGLLGAATGGKVDVSSGGEGVNITNDQGSLSLGKAAEWPSDMPTNVPKFTYGTPSAASKVAEGNWTVLFEKVATDAQAKYTADLTAKGWTQDVASLDDTSGAQIVQMTDGKYSLIVTFDASSKAATLMVSTKTQ